MVKLESSNLAGVEMGANGLRVHFKNGTAYDYPEAGQSTMDALIAADSAGRYFASVIRPNFKGTRVNLDDEGGSA